VIYAAREPVEIVGCCEMALNTLLEIPADDVVGIVCVLQAYGYVNVTEVGPFGEPHSGHRLGELRRSYPHCGHKPGGIGFRQYRRHKVDTIESIVRIISSVRV
jgi:hypothetical protein